MDKLFESLKPVGAGECAGCGQGIPDGMTARKDSKERFFCVRCPACPCGGDPDCGADDRRAAAPGDMFYIFVLNEEGHYIHAMDRPCGDCGNRSQAVHDLENPTPEPAFTCAACGRCTHGGSGHGACARVTVLGPSKDGDPVARVHLECLRCKVCNAHAEFLPNGDDRHLQNIWGVTEDREVCHVPCTPCYRCPNEDIIISSRKQLWKRDDGTWGVIHGFHITADRRARAKQRARAKRASLKVAKATSQKRHSTTLPRGFALVSDE